MENLLLKKSNPCGQQLAFDFTGDADVQVTCDETCYTIKDIADYLQNKIFADGQMFRIKKFGQNWTNIRYFRMMVLKMK